jgi:hypothetical protein
MRTLFRLRRASRARFAPLKALQDSAVTIDSRQSMQVAVSMSVLLVFAANSRPQWDSQRVMRLSGTHLFQTCWVRALT